MNILVIDNDFQGAYGSIRIFLDEIVSSLRQMGHYAIVSRSAEESVGLAQGGGIDFSVGIGKYGQYIEGTPIYELLGIRHYQWIIDNPLKMDIDWESTLIQYVIIDRSFAISLAEVRNEAIYLPLGVDITKGKKGDADAKQEGLVFSGQIKNYNEIYAEIRISKRKKIIENLIDEGIADMQEPLAQIMKNKLEGYDLNFLKEIFRPANSYLRAYKREFVIQSLKEYPVVIIGEVSNKQVGAKKNVTCLGKKSYGSVFGIISGYKYSLSIEPNFNQGLHDRMLRSVLAGTFLVANDGEETRELFGGNAVLYQYKTVQSIERDIAGITGDVYRDRLEAARKAVMEKCPWQRLLGKLTEDYLREE